MGLVLGRVLELQPKGDGQQQGHQQQMVLSWGLRCWQTDQVLELAQEPQLAARDLHTKNTGEYLAKIYKASTARRHQ